MAESTATSISCRVGRADLDACFIQSPRTGQRITFTRDILPVLPRIWGRILQKLSTGTLVVQFTPDELHAVKAFADAQAEHEAAKRDNPPRHFGMNRRGTSDYIDWKARNPGKRERGYGLRPDDTFEIECHTTDWPPLGTALWFRHPIEPAMIVAGEAIQSLPAGTAEKFDEKRATFTGSELNWLYAACVATQQQAIPIRHRRHFRRF